MSDQLREEIAQVIAALPFSRFLVAIGEGEQLTAVLSPSLVGRHRRPGFTVGDLVTVERSPFEPGMCRIISAKSNA